MILHSKRLMWDAPAMRVPLQGSGVQTVASGGSAEKSGDTSREWDLYLHRRKVLTLINQDFKMKSQTP